MRNITKIHYTCKQAFTTLVKICRNRNNRDNHLMTWRLKVKTRLVIIDINKNQFEINILEQR